MKKFHKETSVYSPPPSASPMEKNRKKQTAELFSFMDKLKNKRAT
ncbi:hypothetical protein B4099_3525 [Heyndrickxia coagulans]|uniref:Uncharacterized protein n=1 Tax=Heyndrickxia coagulans TaxID=1398 RepID=A0A150K8K0_HEYCO|nr:hypothetical protein B4099_3525 [Heyndrickxia coagulans]